eukprot:280777_1
MFQTKREYSFLFVCALLVVSSGFHFAHAANDDNVEVDAHAANDENVEVDVSDHYKLIDVALKTSKVIMKKFGKMESEDELRRQSAEFHVKTQKALTETVAELENEYPDLRADLRHTIRKRLKILYSKISLFEKEKYRILEEREMDYNLGVPPLDSLSPCASFWCIFLRHVFSNALYSVSPDSAEVVLNYGHSAVLNGSDLILYKFIFLIKKK